MTFAGGVDLGGTKIQTVVWQDGVVTGKGRVLTPRSGAEDVVEAIRETLRGAAYEAKVDLADATGIGVGSPGTIVDGVVNQARNVPGMEVSFPLAEELSKALGGLPVVLDNDVRVAMLGEHQAGSGRSYKNLLGVFCGTGVGGGLVLEDRIRTGRGSAGEIGHTLVADQGRECSCGRRGCLEAYAGRGRIEAEARLRVRKGKKTILFDVMKERKRDRLSSGTIATAIERGDKLAIELVDDAVWAMGIALANAQNLLDLEAIIIGGGLGDRLGRPFIDRVGGAMAPHLHVPESPPAMLGTELGDLSGAVGAALLALPAAT
ncbi:MAG TPA: ROK family protein [Candidatus Dormibacteraeota bacterium]|nr:ROK family protein [Candidatus Dormibacteraeota bacterium]